MPSPNLIRLFAALHAVVKVTPVNEFAHSPNPVERVDEPCFVLDKLLGPHSPQLDRNRPSASLLEDHRRGDSRQCA
ncbi:hypothetical protein A2T55_11325 [Brevibacterium linens]|uniref:Uncharacterized protein n=1 Tax=Brevibacterium linens TaxID=1703 RepID=A0A142NNC8_BRELN|nr:hypothetical protein A2T55_11325 [Brevibacterium linens]